MMKILGAGRAAFIILRLCPIRIDNFQSWPIVKIAINSNSNSSERPLSNSNTNSNSLEVSLAIAISIAIVPKMVNSNSKSIAIVQFLLLKRALKGIFISDCIFIQSGMHLGPKSVF